MFKYRLYSLVLWLILLSACSSDEDPQESSEPSSEDQVEEVIKQETEDETAFSMEYDELQQLYLDIDENITYDELLEKVEESSLFYSEFSGNSNAIKIAFEEEVTPFRHAESGDSVEVSFGDDLTFDHATYFNNALFITLLHYQTGTYYEFRDQPEYAGYYINEYHKG